jgi:hypothetical protein
MKRMIQMTTNSKKMKVELEIDMESLPELMKLLVEKQGDLKKVEPVVPSDHLQTITIPASGSGITVRPYVPSETPIQVLPWTPDPNSTARPLGSPCMQCGWSGWPCKCSTAFTDPNIKYGQISYTSATVTRTRSERDGDPTATVIIRN